MGTMPIVAPVARRVSSLDAVLEWPERASRRSCCGCAVGPYCRQGGHRTLTVPAEAVGIRQEVAVITLLILCGLAVAVVLIAGNSEVKDLPPPGSHGY
jgi:hypothetical protein